MKLTLDTNILLRAVLDDDPEQGEAARALLSGASLLATPVPVFCELAWVLKRLYKRTPDEVADLIEATLRVETVVTDRPAIEAGVALLRAGGDFADGAIAWQGTALGGEVFATFDREAARLLDATGLRAAEPRELSA